MSEGVAPVPLEVQANSPCAQAQGFLRKLVFALEVRGHHRRALAHEELRCRDAGAREANDDDGGILERHGALITSASASRG